MKTKFTRNSISFFSPEIKSDYIIIKYFIHLIKYYFFFSRRRLILRFLFVGGNILKNYFSRGNYFYKVIHIWKIARSLLLSPFWMIFWSKKLGQNSNFLNSGESARDILKGRLV